MNIRYCDYLIFNVAVRSTGASSWCPRRFHHFSHILVIAFSDYIRGKVTSWEKSLPGKSYFPGKVTSQEMSLPGKIDFLGNLTSQES